MLKWGSGVCLKTSCGLDYLFQSLTGQVCLHHAESVLLLRQIAHISVRLPVVQRHGRQIVESLVQVVFHVRWVEKRENERAHRKVHTQVVTPTANMTKDRTRHLCSKRLKSAAASSAQLPTFDIDTTIEESDWLKSDEGAEVLDPDLERVAVVELQVHVDMQS